MNSDMMVNPNGNSSSFSQDFDVAGDPSGGTGENGGTPQGFESQDPLQAGNAFRDAVDFGQQQLQGADPGQQGGGCGDKSGSDVEPGGVAQEGGVGGASIDELLEKIKQDLVAKGLSEDEATQVVNKIKETSGGGEPDAGSSQEGSDIMPPTNAVLA
jgi:hypothetical protein